MPFAWPIDKLGVIQSALTQTADNVPAVANDGSDEWAVCDQAYERALAYAIEQHSWGFTTKVATLTPAVGAPADTQWDTAYDFPPDLVHLIWVRIADPSNPSSTTAPTRYGILDGQLVINAQGGPPPPSPPATPAAVTVKYVSSTQADPVFGTPTLVLMLQACVMSGIYRGLHEDTAEADKMWMAGMQLLQDARTRYDQQLPKRSFFNHRITAARRIRRPWPPVGGEWGGTGTPG